MKSSREIILESIRANTVEREARPDISDFTPITYPDKIAQFIEISKGVGGVCHVNETMEEVNQKIVELFPNAKRIGSNLPYITCATYNPDELENPGDLNGTDVGIIEGELGVCENGCVWVEEKMRHRSLCFISENLVIILRKENLVNNMHEAYRAVKPCEKSYRCFISGPSKTADIEQALVVGAHGARTTAIMLV